MNPNGNKRKMDRTDEDVIPGTPQEKHSKKKQRKKSVQKCSDCEVLIGTENVVVKDSVVDNELDQENFDELLHGIDFLDDFNIENVQVSIYVVVIVAKVQEK